MARLVAEAGDDGYYHGALELRKIDKNAYTYLLQSEMQRSGLYTGRLNGLMTQSTLRAILRFCGSRGDRRLCELGPLKSDPAKFIIRELLSLRVAEGQQEDGVHTVRPSNVAVATDAEAARRAVPQASPISATQTAANAMSTRHAGPPRNAGRETHHGSATQRNRGGSGSSRVVGVFKTPSESWILVQRSGGDIVEVRVGQEIDGVPIREIGGNYVEIEVKNRRIALRAGDRF